MQVSEESYKIAQILSKLTLEEITPFIIDIVQEKTFPSPYYQKASRFKVLSFTIKSYDLNIDYSYIRCDINYMWTEKNGKFFDAKECLVYFSELKKEDLHKLDRQRKINLI